MSTTTNIHGHEILHFVHAAQPPVTRAQLIAHVTKTYGADARFCTCSAAGMTFDDLLGFLVAAGKIVERGGVLYTDMSKVCANEDPDHHHHH